MSEPTDTERLDFLQAQRFTKWVGYDMGALGACVWPVFGHTDLRAAMDAAMVRRRHIGHKEEER